MTTQPEPSDVRRVAEAAAVIAAMDAADNATKTAVGRAVRKFLGKAVTMRTLGEMYGWWAKEVDSDLLPEIRHIWRKGFSIHSRSTSLDGIEVYMANVRDRLVRGLEPPLPEAAFDQVRKAIIEGAASGWSTDQTAQRIAASLSWERDGAYWRSVEAQAADRIDSLLDRLGPPGTPAREWSRLHDPQVQALRDSRNLATSHLDAERSYWQDRALKIARTETTGAFNAGALMGLRSEGWAFKEWLATNDSHTRESHRLAEGQVVALASPFHVGASLLMMPGDPTGPPGEVINCRCTVLGSDGPGLSLVAAVHDVTKQARVPKGNGHLSGRWIDMPGTILDDLTREVDPPTPAMVKIATDYGADLLHKPFDNGVMLDKAAKILLKDPNLKVKAAGSKLEDFASVDWYSDPANPPDPIVETPNPDFFVLNNGKVTLEQAYKMVAKAYDWEIRDSKGAKPADKDSVHEQGLAQIAAKVWSSKAGVDQSGVSADHGDSTAAAGWWLDYQSAADYEPINKALRTPGDQGDIPSTVEGTETETELRKQIERAFAEGGWTTTKPITVYRALRSGRGHDWATTLTPGTVFQEDGMVSATADSIFAKGWLGGTDPDNLKPSKADDVVLEIRVPKGTRILGGDPQFIETMMKPGSKFKVISSTVENEVGISPLGSDSMTPGKSPGPYTHVVAELVP